MAQIHLLPLVIHVQVCALAILHVENAAIAATHTTLEEEVQGILPSISNVGWDSRVTF